VEVLELDLGMGLAKGINHGREVVQVQPAGEPKHQAAGDNAGCRARLIGRLGRLRKDRTRTPVERLARPRELHSRSATLEQRRLQLPFEVFHLAAEGGLGDAQPCRRVREVQFLSHRHEVSEVSQFHAPTIPAAHGWTKEQSIGRKPPPGVKGEVMNETNATMTATAAGAAEVRSPKAEIRRKAEGPNGEAQAPQLIEQVQDSGDTFHASRITFHAPRSRQLSLALLAAAVTTTAAWSAYHWADYVRTWVKTDNAYVAAHIHQVSSRVAGTVSEVLVEENDLVEAGKIVARLDPRDFEVRHQQALAEAAQAQAHLQQAEAQVAQARAEVSRERAQATKAQQDLERAKVLSEGGHGAISRQEFDAAKAAADAAQASLEVAGSALQSAEAATAAARAQQRVAQANLKDAELQLSYTEIRAPAAGRIGRKNLETGNRVQPGQALLALVQPDVWVVANFKETQLARLKPGQPVRLRVDALPGRVWAGHVESLAAASGSQFALLPPDNATGNFIKIVQRVPVKIALDRQGAGDCEGRIVPGMSTVVEVKVRE